METTSDERCPRRPGSAGVRSWPLRQPGQASPRRRPSRSASFAADPADGPILKPLPERYFTVYGTNAEMRWDSVDPHRHLTPQPRLFVRNHTRTPRIDPHSYRLSVFGDGLRQARTRTRRSA